AVKELTARGWLDQRWGTMKVRFVISAVVLMACSVATLSAAKPAMAQGNSDPSEARQKHATC
ncbi:hypothetical protein, partial [Cutibacterium modestum]|uniref:hypothetical protein n=1 Tax=Cutibacterium modestum TaxID=2559073 RepID=UPI001E4FEA6C